MKTDWRARWVVIRGVSKKFGELYQKTSLIWLLWAPDQGSTVGGLLSVSPPEEHQERRTFCRRGGNPRTCDSGFAHRFLKRHLLTVSRSFMNVTNSVLWRMTIILKANKVNLFVSSVLLVFWYHSPNILDTPRMSSEHDTQSRLQTSFDGTWNCGPRFEGSFCFPLNTGEANNTYYGDIMGTLQCAAVGTENNQHWLQLATVCYTVRSESCCALRLRYVDLVVSIEVAVAMCCCLTVFSC
jgi:hypothetical protein